LVAGLSDGPLLDRFVDQGEGAALEALLRRHAPMVWGVCRRLLRDHHDAEDSFQATFLVLARQAASIRPREKVGNWLYGVAYQTARKARATRARRRLREAQVPDAPEPKAASGGRREDLAEFLDHELSRLPDKYHTPIVLCELEGRTHGEAAERLGWPVGTVSGRLSRAKSMLAKRLTRRGLSLAGGSLAVLLAQHPATASAGVPAALLTATLKAASLVAAGQAVPVAVGSAKVAALTKEVLKAMFLSRIRTITVALLAFTLVGAGLRQAQTWADEGAPPEGNSRAVVREARGTALPERTFRVTVNEVLREESAVVTQIDIETPPRCKIELLSDKGTGAGTSFSSDKPGPNGLCSFRLIVFADHLEMKEGATNAVKFMIAHKFGGISRSTSETVPMPAGAKVLADVLSVPIKSGEYKFGQVTKLVTFKGVRYTLVVNWPE
jgi:RNA polymerase sigma factor (sigma-70 family)